MPDYDPLTISDEDLKALPPSDRAKVYKARAQARAAGGATGAPRAAPSAPAAAPAPAASAAPGQAGTSAGGATTSAAASTPGAPATSAGDGSAPAAAAPGQAAREAVVPKAPAAATAPSTPAGPSAPEAQSAPAPARAAAAPPKEPEKPKEPPFVQRVLQAIPSSTWQWRHGYAEIKVPRERLLDAARSLKSAGFDYLSFITEVDWQDRLELVYHLFSYDFRTQPLGVILRADLPREGMPQVASVTTVWPGAEFMEREAFEMMGISFLGHPDLRRILLPDDFVGFPMRRDYETDFEYITVKQLVHESD